MQESGSSSKDRHIICLAFLLQGGGRDGDGRGEGSCVQLRFLKYQPRILFQIHFVLERRNFRNFIMAGECWLLVSLVWTLDYKVGRGIELRMASAKK